MVTLKANLSSDLYFGLLVSVSLPSSHSYRLALISRIYALRSIVPGEELLVSYVSLSQFPKVEARQRHLLTQYGFTCQCNLCKNTSQ